MALNNSHQALIDTRRLRVSQLLLRGATQREIETALFDNGMMNPKTGKPFSLGTVNSDIQHLHKQWREEAAADTAEHKALQMAENKELRRKAWKDAELPIVLRSLQFEAALVGSEAPKRNELTGADGGNITIHVKYDDA